MLGMTAFGCMFLMSYHVFGDTAGSIVNIVVYTLSTASGVASIPLALAHPFFQLGYALPFYHIVTGMRTILFNSGESLGLNVGVMLLWIAGVFVCAWRLVLRRQRVGRVVEVIVRQGTKHLNHLHKHLHHHHEEAEGDKDGPAAAGEEEEAGEVERYSVVVVPREQGVRVLSSGAAGSLRSSSREGPRSQGHGHDLGDDDEADEAERMV